VSNTLFEGIIRESLSIEELPQHIYRLSFLDWFEKIPLYKTEKWVLVANAHSEERDSFFTYSVLASAKDEQRAQVAGRLVLKRESAFSHLFASKFIYLKLIFSTAENEEVSQVTEKLKALIIHIVILSFGLAIMIMIFYSAAGTTNIPGSRAFFLVAFIYFQ